jgi:ketosteroid isomerase-like protein
MGELLVLAGMSQNKKLIESLGSTERSKLGLHLADDVEWVEWADGVPPTGAITRGKAAFIQNYGNDQVRSQITRMTEENNVVVAEGTVQITKKDGHTFAVRFCDIYEFENGKVKRKTSFGAVIKDSE